MTVLGQDNQHCTLFMDEPEISLHIEWQQRLISLIRSLNALYGRAGDFTSHRMATTVNLTNPEP